MKAIFVYYLCLVLIFTGETDSARRRKKSKKSDAKIVGGRETSINEAPYQVSLAYRDKHICGGSMLDNNHVLTAAHCVERGNPSEYSVRAGSDYHYQGGETRQVEKITRHPNYNTRTSNNDAAVLRTSRPFSNRTVRIMQWNNKIKRYKENNDVAVLRLSKPFKFGKNIQPVTLADRDPRPGERVFVTGWGATYEGGRATPRMRSATVPAVSRQSCQRSYMRHNTITDSMWCAGYPQGGKDACQGDSGGPAMVNGRQAGIVSWGSGCARRNSPGVYTSVPRMRPWIRKQMN